MNSSKKKILVPLVLDNWIRLFVDSGALDGLRQEYEVHFLAHAAVTRQLDVARWHRTGECGMSMRARKRMLSLYISMKRYEERCSTFPVKYRETFYLKQPIFKRLALDFLTLPGIAEIFMDVRERTLGTVEEIDRAISQIRPDLALIPCSFNDMFSLDVMKSAKARGIKTLLMMLNWDNVSSKGVLPFLPDYMTVWGQQTFEHAVHIQKMPAGRVRIMGAPQFEHYRQDISISAEEMRRRNGIPLEKKVILFTGMSRLIDEIGLLASLQEAVKSKTLPGVHIHYRPHPWKVVYPGEKNFFDCGFTDITMDVQLKDHYVRTLTDPQYRKKGQNNFVPEYGYYPSLFNAVDAVISPGTTMGIEAMLAGKPVLVKGFGDDDSSMNADRMIHTYAHHDCWRRMPSAILCRDRKDFIPDCLRLLGLAQEPGIAERLRRDVAYVVDMQGAPFSQRILSYVQEIL